MIQLIKDAAAEVGIVAFITNSTERIETQLNRIVREEDLPIMLVSWDIDVNLVFDPSGFLQNPTVNIVSLLVEKPETTSKEEAEKSAVAMGVLFQTFLQKLHSKLIIFQKQTDPPVSNASYKLTPIHGAGKHSGVLGRFTMRIAVTNC